MISRSFYNFILGGCIFWGFAINYIICVFFSEYVLMINPVVLLVGYFILALIGIFMSKLSNNALVSFIGFNFVVVPIGAVLSIVLAEYKSSTNIVIEAIAITGIVTLVITILSIIKPELFKNMGKVLFISLGLLVICELALVLFTHKVPIIIEWIACGIFCGYIGFDISRAQYETPTVDNAVDMAVSLYLDVVNLFLRILKILGEIKKK